MLALARVTLGLLVSSALVAILVGLAISVLRKPQQTRARAIGSCIGAGCLVLVALGICGIWVFYWLMGY